jgi:hypothetical protein
MCKYCDDKSAIHAERNAYRVSDEEEMPHRGKGGKKPKRFKGCPARDGKAHVYVWIEYHGKRWGWSRGPYGLEQKMRDAVWYEQVCVGCDFVKNRHLYWFGGFGKEIYEVRIVEYGW